MTKITCVWQLNVWQTVTLTIIGWYDKLYVSLTNNNFIKHKITVFQNVSHENLNMEKKKLTVNWQKWNK